MNDTDKNIIDAEIVGEIPGENKWKTVSENPARPFVAQVPSNLKVGRWGVMFSLGTAMAMDAVDFTQVPFLPDVIACGVIFFVWRKQPEILSLLLLALVTVLEMIPGISMFPSWTALVLFLIARQNGIKLKTNS